MPLFAQYGIKSVSMNEIAATMRISKKTLYEQFESKEELLRKSFDYEVGRQNEEIRQIENKSRSGLETLVRISQYISGRISSLCPAFYKEARRYPALLEQWDANRKLFENRCLHYLAAAADEGDLIPRRDYEHIAALYVEQVSEVKPDYKQTMIGTFLRGLATDQGRTALDRLESME